MQETFLYHNVEIFQKSVKSKVKITLGTFLDFAYFSCYLQTKKKRGQATFLESKML